MSLVTEYAPVMAIGVMGVLMGWYWFVAYKHDLMRGQLLWAWLIGGLTPSLLVTVLGFLTIFSAFPGSVPGLIFTDTMRWLPIFAFGVVGVTCGFIYGSALGSISDTIKDKHKIWYAFSSYQLLMIIEVLVR